MSHGLEDGHRGSVQGEPSSKASSPGSSESCTSHPSGQGRSSESIRVLIVGGQELFRAAVGALIKRYRDLLVVGDASPVSDLRAAIARTQPHVVVTDLTMPIADRAHVLLQLKSRRPRVNLIVLGPTEQPAAVVQAFRDGARGYLAKDCSPSTLANAIRAVYAGNTWIEPEMVRACTDELRRSRGPSCSSDELLTPRERDVLSLLGLGKDTAAIAQRLGISDRAVRMHVKRILAKLGLANMLEAVRYAIKHGLAIF